MKIKKNNKKSDIQKKHYIPLTIIVPKFSKYLLNQVQRIIIFPRRTEGY